LIQWTQNLLIEIFLQLLESLFNITTLLESHNATKFTKMALQTKTWVGGTFWRAEIKPCPWIRMESRICFTRNSLTTRRTLIGVSKLMDWNPTTITLSTILEVSLTKSIKQQVTLSSPTEDSTHGVEQAQQKPWELPYLLAIFVIIC
jgi:hypothetical protein